MTSPMLAAALRYAAVGWPVLPCWPTPTPGVCACPRGPACKSRGKHPTTLHGVGDATTDPDLIETWWRVWPAANVAIATGTPGPDVVDIDCKDGRPGLASLDRLRGAGLLRGALAVVGTPSGGLHIHFTGSTQPNGSQPKAGVDFRSAGGYVIAPPSTVDGRVYVVHEHRAMDQGRTVNWAAIVAHLTPPRPAPPPATPLGRTGDPDRLARWASRELDRLLTEPVAVGERSERFHELVGLARKAGLSEAETVATLTSWCSSTGKYAGRVDREVRRSLGKRPGVAA